jgi:uncharacterized membrane protein
MTTRPTISNKSPVKKTPVKRTAAQSTSGKRTSAKAAPARRSSGNAPSGPDADSPILPVDQLDALRRIKPGAVDWVIQQTQIEAEHRRAETKRVNELVFIEHLLSQISALIIGVAGIWGGSWVAVNGQPWFGFAIAAVVVIGLVVVQLSARKKRP